jgi:hypothetical protein
MAPDQRHGRTGDALDERTVASVASSTTGPDTDSYEAHAQAIRSSLRFWQSGSPPDTVSAPLAMLRSPTNTPERGCDDVVFVDVPVARSPSLLTTALDTLFALDRDSVGGARHFLARTNETLRLDRAMVVADTARVFLEGRLSGLRGVCDNPRARIQIEETVRRIAGVEGVTLFLNGQRTTLQPDGRGEGPPGAPTR